MKLKKKFAALGVALLTVCIMFTSCTGQREDTGVAYEKNMKIESAKDLEGKVVAVQLRSEADVFVVDEKLTNYVKRYENMEDAAKDLAEKKVAALVVDDNYAKKLVAGNDEIKIVDADIDTVEYKFAALKENGGDKVISSFNKRITALKATEGLHSIVNSELVKGEDVTVEKDEKKKLKKNVTFVADPYFKPFIYKQDKAFQGFFAAIAEDLAYAYDANLEIKEAKPGDTLAALANNENAFTVVSGEIDTEKYAVTETFYTSKLVIVTRKDNSK